MKANKKKRNRVDEWKKIICDGWVNGTKKRNGWRWKKLEGRNKK